MGTQLGPRLDRRGGLNLAFDLKESLNIFQLLISRLKQFFAFGVLSQCRRLFAIPGSPLNALKGGRL